MDDTISSLFLKELESEVAATRKCLERIPPSLFKYKPHEKSMQMGDLVLMAAEIPKWITASLKDGEINFETWQRHKLTTTEDVLKYLDQNVKDAKKILAETSDKALEKMFYLKSGKQELMKSSNKDNISSLINHWVHHRGQMTVYMRLNDIPVPSIYGPSADDKTF